MGYTWQGMKKISKEEAEQLYLNNRNFYFLYDDESECDVSGKNFEDIEEHYNYGGEFGIEK